jgi:hypothetical protein
MRGGCGVVGNRTLLPEPVQFRSNHWGEDPYWIKWGNTIGLLPSDTFCCSRACQKATGPLFFSTWTLSATDIHIHVSDGFNDTNEIGFHKSPKNYTVHQAWTSCATLAHHFFPPKINIAISENGHESLWVNPSQSI